MEHSYDDAGLILTKRDVSKRKKEINWEGVYEIRDDVYRIQFQFAGITINLGETPDPIEGAQIYTGFVHEIGDEMREAIESGLDFTSTVRLYLGKDPKYIKHAEKAITDYKNKTGDRNDLSNLDALKQAVNTLEGKLPSVADVKTLISKLGDVDTKNNIERIFAAIEIMSVYYKYTIHRST